MSGNRTRLRVFAAVLVATMLCTSSSALAQLQDVLGQVRQGAQQINPNSPTYYLKSAKAVETNVCLYSNGDPTGLLGPLVFRNSYVATPNCREFRACSETSPIPEEPRPADCGAEIPNSKYWSTDSKRLRMRSDSTATLEFESEEFVKVRTCNAIEKPVLMCTTGNVGLFRAEVEYDYPNGDKSRYNWDRYQNLAGRAMETKTALSWDRSEESVKTGNRQRTSIAFTGVPNEMVPAHEISARITHQYGDAQAAVFFDETGPDRRHYASLKSSSGNAQHWEVATDVQRRPSPPVSRVGFIPATYTISIEDRMLPDLVALPGAASMENRYLITVFTEHKHRDETLIFQTEAANTRAETLFSVRMDQEALLSMKGKSKKIRVHVRALRRGNPWVDNAVSPTLTYETPKDVKFPKK